MPMPYFYEAIFFGFDPCFCPYQVLYKNYLGAINWNFCQNFLEMYTQFYFGLISIHDFWTFKLLKFNELSKNILSRYVEIRYEPLLSCSYIFIYQNVPYLIILIIFSKYKILEVWPVKAMDWSNRWRLLCCWYLSM